MPPATDHAVQDRRTPWCEMGSMPCDTEELSFFFFFFFPFRETRVLMLCGLLLRPSGIFFFANIVSPELRRALRPSVFQGPCVGWVRSSGPDLIPCSARLCQDQLFLLVFCGLLSWSVQVYSALAPVTSSHLKIRSTWSSQVF